MILSPILMILNTFFFSLTAIGKFRREFKNAFTCMCFRTKQPSTICRNNHHQTTKILSRQPMGNRVRANPQQIVEQTSQSFTNNPTVNFGAYLNQSPPSRTSAGQQPISNNAMVSQVEMPALRDWLRSTRESLIWPGLILKFQLYELQLLGLVTIE